MKTKIFAALLALASFGLLSCEKKFIGNDTPPPQYLLALELVDQEGNNISEIAANSTTGTIVYSDSGVELWDPRFYSRLCEDNIRYFITHGGGDFPDRELSELSLTWKIKSEVIFGDQDIHLIKSEWVMEEEVWLPRCTSFEFEGKTYVPERKNGNATARVVINR